MRLTHLSSEASAHGAFECVDCHAESETLPHSETADRTSCSDCHGDTEEAYESSIHGRSYGNGSTEAPTCEACHGGIHYLLPASDSESMVHPQRLPDTCGKCHADPEIIRKYGIPIAQPVEAYRQSVHAQATTNGVEGATWR